MKVEITRRASSRRFSAPALRRVVTRILRLLEQPSHTQLSLLMTDDAEIHILNSTWRQKDRPTDVLSFSMREGGGIRGEALGGLLGDIVLSGETCTRQAEDKGWSVEEEVSFLLLHGVLHLLGYDHEKDEDHEVMEAKTQEIWAFLHPEVKHLMRQEGQTRG